MKKAITLIDTLDDGITYAEVVEYCEMNDEEIPQENSAEHYAIASTIVDWEIEDFWDNLKAISDDLGAVVVFGSIGRWNGRYDINAKAFDNLYDAVLACLDCCDYYKVEQKHSAIEVCGYHHDGHNDFTIKFLNDKGLDAKDKNKYYGRNIDLTNRRYHKTLNEIIF